MASSIAFEVSLQPTYEELKLPSETDTSVCRKSLQPTYEELKRPMRNGFSARFIGLQPTYEELKLPGKLLLDFIRVQFAAYL